MQYKFILLVPLQCDSYLLNDQKIVIEITQNLNRLISSSVSHPSRRRNYSK